MIGRKLRRKKDRSFWMETNKNEYKLEDRQYKFEGIALILAKLFYLPI